MGDPAIFEDQHPVGQFDRLVHVVVDQQDTESVSAPKVEQQCTHGQPGERIQRAERLVEQQQLWFGHQCACQRNPLCLTAGQCERPGVGVGGKADLGQRLNVALAQRVQELSRYRSEFFGRLRAILGNRPDIRIVGDRFVFQSEVFFDTGQALLLPEGRAELDKLATALIDLDKQIPAEIAWVLRVDGHTDVRPITNSPLFKSNWELSSARAISVVQYLVSLGVPPQRLVAAGFAEFQPLDTAATEEAYKRNRRIELKLTER